MQLVRAADKPLGRTASSGTASTGAPTEPLRDLLQWGDRNETPGVDRKQPADDGVVGGDGQDDATGDDDEDGEAHVTVTCLLLYYVDADDYLLTRGIRVNTRDSAGGMGREEGDDLCFNYTTVIVQAYARL